MRKLLAVLLCLLFPVCCLAENLAVGGTENTAVVSLGTGFAEKCGMSLILAESEESAADAMLASGDTFCLCTQQMIIRALQGYAEGDPRTDMRAAAILAADDVFLVMRCAAAEQTGISDLTSFMEYVAENPYSIVLMRLLDADPYDRACCVLMGEMDVDAEQMYFDLEDMVACSESDVPYVLLTGAADAAALSGEGFTVVGCLGGARSPYFPETECAAEAGMPVCQGVWYGIFGPAGSDVSSVAAFAADLSADSSWQELLQTHYLRSVQTDDFQAFVTEQCTDLVSYMTMEGLFFYEE